MHAILLVNIDQVLFFEPKSVFDVDFKKRVKKFMKKPYFFFNFFSGFLNCLKTLVFT